MSDKEKIVREGYNRIAKEYQADRHIFTRREELETFAGLLVKRARVLDIGCGAGVPVTHFLVERGFDVIGVDFSESMLELARENIPIAEYVKGSMTRLGFEDNSFDGLTAFYSIIHVPRERHFSLFRDFHRILRPEGVMLVCMGPDDWEAVDQYYGMDMFWSHYSPEKTLQLVRDVGFQIIFGRYIRSGGETHYWILAKNLKRMNARRRSSH